MITKYNFELIVDEPYMLPGYDPFCAAVLERILEDAGFKIENVTAGNFRPSVTTLLLKKEDTRPSQDLHCAGCCGRGEVRTTHPDGNGVKTCKLCDGTGEEPK